MANYNIEMQYYNGTSYDVLYPNIPLSSVSDWNDSIYSKSEVDSTINSVNTQISNIQSFIDIGDWSALVSNRTVTHNEITEDTTDQILGQNWLNPYEDAIIYIHRGFWSFHMSTSSSTVRSYSANVGGLTLFLVEGSRNDSESGTITPKWGVIVGTGVTCCNVSIYNKKNYTIGPTLGYTRMFSTENSTNYPLSNALTVIGSPPGYSNTYMSFSVTFSVYKRTNPLFYGFTQAGISLT